MQLTASESPPADVQADRRRTELESSLGPELWTVLDDPDVRELDIRPNGYAFTRRTGKNAGKGRVPGIALSAPELDRMARAIVFSMSGEAELNDKNPVVGGKMLLSDKASFARVAVFFLPETACKYMIAIRKHSAAVVTLEQQVEGGVLVPEDLEIFEWTARARRNIMVVGSSYTGKTTLGNGIIEKIRQLDPDRAVGYIEDVPETVCSLENSTPMLVTRHFSASDWLRASMRGAFESIWLSELRDEAAIVLRSAWTSDHNGGLTTAHAGTALEAMYRWESFERMGGIKEPSRAEIAQAVHVIAVLKYDEAIGRKVTGIYEVGFKDGNYAFSPLRAERHWPIPERPTGYGAA